MLHSSHDNSKAVPYRLLMLSVKRRHVVSGFDCRNASSPGAEQNVTS